MIPKSVPQERLAALDRGERLFNGGFLQFPGGPCAARSLWEA